MDVSHLRAKVTRTLAAGILALTEGRTEHAHQCADGALFALLNLSAHGVTDADLIERVARLEDRLSAQG